MLNRRCPALLLGLLLSTSAIAGVTEQSYGKWLGQFQVQERTMQSGLELFARADGSPNGQVVHVQRGFQTARLRAISEVDGALEIDGPNRSHLSLKLVQGELVGELAQNGLRLPIRFHRVDSFGEPLRAQTPRGALPYRSEELLITSADGSKLSATLTRPSGTGTVPAVVLIHGTGPEDRDQTEEGHKGFAVLADHLTRQGIAVLRYDKRGVMRSGGSFDAHTLADLLADAQAAVAALRAQPGIGKVGVIGHSEGGELAARLAARATPAVHFMVSLAGPGLDLLPVLETENRRALSQAGASEAEQAMVLQLGRQYYPIVRDQADTKARMQALGALMQGLSPEQRATMSKFRAVLPTFSGEVASSPWAHSALNTHPGADWRAVKVPALVLNGEKDQQMDAAENIAAIGAAFKDNGNTMAELAILPSLNHNFQTAETGAPGDYARIDETMAPAVLQRVAAFILKQR